MENTPVVGSIVSTTVKAWYTSTTVWLAILQAVVGFLGALILILQGGLTQESVAALGVGIKGLIDLRQRFITTQPII